MQSALFDAFSDIVLPWVYSYLTSRTGRCSSWLATSSGMPQGLVLSPLLFTLFINNICSSLKFYQYMIFADDTQIYLSCLVHGINFIVQDFGVIVRYATDNDLRLNLANKGHHIGQQGLRESK